MNDSLLSPNNSVTRQFGWHAIGRLAAALVVLGSFFVLTRIMKPDEFGLYSIIIYIGGLAHIIVFQWLRILVDREVPSAHNLGQDEVVAYLTTWGILTSLLGSICLLSSFEMPSLRNALLAFFLFTSTYALFEIAMATARARLQARRTALVHFGKSAIGLVLSTLLVVAGHGWTGAVVGLAAAQLLCALGAFRPVPRLGRLRLSSLPSILSGFRVAYPASLSLAFGWLMLGAGRLVVVTVNGSAEGGRFVAAFDLASQSVLLVLSVAFSSFFPHVVRLHDSRETQAFRLAMRRFGEFSLAVGSATAGILISLSDDLIGLVLGREFHEGATLVFSLACLATLCLGIANFYFDTVFQLVRRTRVLVLIGGAAVALNLCLLLLFVPRWGSVGASVASIIANLGYMLVSRQLGQRAIPGVLTTRTMSVALVMPFSGALGFGLLAGQVSHTGHIASVALVGCMGLFGALAGTFVANICDCRTWARTLFSNQSSRP